MAADVPKMIVEEDSNDVDTAQQQNNIDPIRKSEQELSKKYPGLSPKAKIVAQRKISTGGTQYFDSGEYAIQASRKDKQRVASNPKPVFNPALARLQGKPMAVPQPRRPLPSSLASSSSTVGKVEQ